LFEPQYSSAPIESWKSSHLKTVRWTRGVLFQEPLVDRMVLVRGPEVRVVGRLREAVVEARRVGHVDHAAVDLHAGDLALRTVVVDRPERVVVDEELVAVVRRLDLEEHPLRRRSERPDDARIAVDDERQKRAAPSPDAPSLFVPRRYRTLGSMPLRSDTSTEGSGHAVGRGSLSIV
jgi:hypothetical protein